MDNTNTVPDFANTSSVQGLGQMLAAYAVTIEARLAALEPVVSAPTVEGPAAEGVQGATTPEDAAA